MSHSTTTSRRPDLQLSPSLSSPSLLRRYLPLSSTTCHVSLPWRANSEQTVDDIQEARRLCGDGSCRSEERRGEEEAVYREPGTTIEHWVTGFVHVSCMDQGCASLAVSLRSTRVEQRCCGQFWFRHFHFYVKICDLRSNLLHVSASNTEWMKLSLLC